MRRYPEYKESSVEWIGEIPRHWETKAVWMMFHLGRGRVISNEEIAVEHRKIELLKEYRQSLISEAVTGKIDVRNEA